MGNAGHVYEKEEGIISVVMCCPGGAGMQIWEMFATGGGEPQPHVRVTVAVTGIKRA